jgi:hypothetical protein
LPTTAQSLALEEQAAVAATRAVLEQSLQSAHVCETPYRHWLISDLFDPSTIDALAALPFPAPDLGGVSGARELHNDTRRYFDRDNIETYPVCGRIARTFQAPETVALFAAHTGANLDGCCLRIEYAQDLSEFWLQPHTDLGVKKLTLLAYLAAPAGQEELGTDIYADAQTWVKRAPFNRGGALLFIPSDVTWHGFEPRAFHGVRKSVIINYVTAEWRAREQLAYPDSPVRAASITRTA